MSPSAVAVYVHVPFCPSKCGYCDFNSFAMSGEIVQRTVDSTVAEIARSPWRGRPAKTIFFGGGTPTFLSGKQLTSILKAVAEAHPPIERSEITSEANPGTVDAEKFHAVREAGFNRLSLGAQSFNNSELLQLGRIHCADEVARAVGTARAAGFTNINLDLMFALPGQSERGWRSNLETAIALQPEHLSLYCLTIEPNTRYYRYERRGMLDLPDDEAQVKMYDLACEMAAQAGYAQYEISNFAKPDRQCGHNLCYWRGEEYLAYGPGAVGCYETAEGTRKRYTVVKHPRAYCEAVEAGAETWCETEDLDQDTLAFERLMLGLRLNEGVQKQGLRLDQNGIENVIRRGWLEERSDRFALTKAGRHFCSEAVTRIAAVSVENPL